MKTFALLIAGLVLAGSASAQGAKPQTGMYVGIEGGVAQFGKSSPERGYRTTSQNSNPGYLRGALGYQFSPNWALEGGYFKTGDGKFAATNGITTIEDKADISGFDLAAVYKSTDMLPGVFVKAGGIASSTKVKSVERTAQAQRVSEASTVGGGYLLGVGFEYDFSQHVSASIGYTRLQRVSGMDHGLNLYNAGVKYRF